MQAFHLSSYIMASYYIAMNRSTGKSAEENFEIFRDGLCASKLFHKVMGDVDSYLDPKKMPGRLKWSEDSHKRLYENGSASCNADIHKPAFLYCYRSYVFCYLRRT